MRPLANLTGFSETMILALVVWLCSAVLVGLVVVPIFGTQVALATGLGLLLVLLAVCWGICGYRAVNDKEGRGRIGRVHLRT